MRRLVLCFFPVVALHAATTVYQASVDQLTVVHGVASPDSAVHHSASKSLRVEAGKPFTDAIVRSAPVKLTIGKRYELSGWVRTDNLVVRDTDRSPIASGAARSGSSLTSPSLGAGTFRTPPPASGARSSRRWYSRHQLVSRQVVDFGHRMLPRAVKGSASGRAPGAERRQLVRATFRARAVCAWTPD